MKRPSPLTAWSGSTIALASALLFGASTPLAKLLLDATDPLLLAGLLYLGSGFGLALFTQGRRVPEHPSSHAAKPPASRGMRHWHTAYRSAGDSRRPPPPAATRESP